MKAMLEVKNLSFGYGKDLVLKDVSFIYEAKDLLLILGPNGGGKSTLFKLILGLERFSKGAINLDMKPREIGFVPQSFVFNESYNMQVIDVVLMGQIDEKRLFFYSKKQKDIALEALARVGMADFAKRGVKELSIGQRQRVFIARALSSSCKLLMLDEPTASVDEVISRQIYELLARLNQEGMGIMLICHDLKEALNYASKALLVNKTAHIHEAKDIIKRRESLAECDSFMF